ncbi:MAG: hypothetical protein JXA22_03390 [Candidatus Thermoplasmatota archaeon]|nr:hypothetical protein [Candidatus Thermoplasmatota archaeon]
MTQGRSETKQNCWEFNGCGRAADHGPEGGKEVCPVSTSLQFDNRNGGKNGGRYCWRVPAGDSSSAGNRPVPNWADDTRDCIRCGFFRKVLKEEGPELRM